MINRLPRHKFPKFVIFRRDQSKNAPNVFFEEKEDESFASKTEVKFMFYILGITLLSFIIYARIKFSIR